MQKFSLNNSLSLILLFILLPFSNIFAQTSVPASIDLQHAGIIIDSLDKQFSRYYFNGDSLALYAMYAKNASLGSLKGNDLRLGIGKMIRNSIQNNARNITYTTTSLSTDNEFLVELGIYEAKDDKGNLKSKGKYLVIWKQENGDWKLYRDMSL